MLRSDTKGLIDGIIFVAVSACACLWVGAAETPGDTWPRFRGAGGEGLGSATNLPVQWDGSKPLWKSALPGRGHSSPVIWNRRVFVTSGDEKDGARFVVCLGTADGKMLWERTFASHTFPMNRDNNYGSATPAVDERGLYVCWTSPEEITALGFSHDGQELWRRNLGTFKGKHGAGASPVVAGGLVWINNDQDGPSALLALDATTGEVKHRIARTTAWVSYGTPCAFKREGLPEELVFASTSHGLTSINPLSGAVNWECAKLFKNRVVGSPVAGDGMVICSSGEGGVGLRLVAVRPPAGNQPATVVYDLKTQIPYVPTPLAKDGLLYLVGDNGLIRCLRTRTGEPVWRQKLEDEFFSSPVYAEGHLYLTSKAGTVYVIAAGDQFELRAKNSLGEASFATPALAGGSLFFRTLTHLLAVGESKPAASP